MGLSRLQSSAPVCGWPGFTSSPGLLSEPRSRRLRPECLTGVFRPAAGDGAQPVAAVAPSVLNVQQGQRAEFRCTATGNPTPAIEWTGRTHRSWIRP